MKLEIDSEIDDIQIQIIPLIDVIFCILTFFILAVLKMKTSQSLNIDNPKAQSNTTQPAERLIISLDPSGQTYVGQQPADRNSLAGEVRKYLDGKPNGTVVLNASQYASYSDVIWILGELRQVGGSRIALATAPMGVTSQPANTSPGFGTPGFGTPGFGTPGFGTPGLGTPGLGVPGLGTPGLGTPGLGTPGLGTPGLGTPGTNPSGLGTPNNSGISPSNGINNGVQNPGYVNPAPVNPAPAGTPPLGESQGIQPQSPVNPPSGSSSGGTIDGQVPAQSQP
jgi:biopolymer transport protein ExbD